MKIYVLDVGGRGEVRFKAWFDCRPSVTAYSYNSAAEAVGTLLMEAIHQDKLRCDIEDDSPISSPVDIIELDTKE